MSLSGRNWLVGLPHIFLIVVVVVDAHTETNLGFWVPKTP